MYKFLRQLLFLFNPERVHHFSMDGLHMLNKIPLLNKKLKDHFTLADKHLERTVLGLAFSNPVGLAAGFDKNALYVAELEALGFGFVEIGTVTPYAQQGNDKPRLFRLKKDNALINRMGFNNDGVEAIAGRLKNWAAGKQRITKTSAFSIRMIIGGNIGKNKVTPNEDAWKDYCTCFNALHPYVDYFVVNVSSPNTPGLRALQEKDSLTKILGELQLLNTHIQSPRPLLLKISPDLHIDQLNEVIDLALEIKLDGLVVANTTTSRQGLLSKASEVMKVGSGGLSGLPLKQRSTEMVTYINKRTGGKLPLIASGGIFTGKDALEKIKAGASLVQVWTGFIYEGPAITKNICKELIRDQS